MPRREALLALAGVALLLVGAVLIARSHGPMRDTRISGAAVRILEPAHSPASGTALVFHGLASNRIFMQQAGQWLSAQGFRVYLVDAPGHGDTPGSFSHTSTLATYIGVLTELQRNAQISGESLDPQTTILVGHSMGSELAIRLADYFPVAGTIAFAPPPMVLPRRMPANLLIIAPQLDLPQMHEAARVLLQNAGGSRTSPEDFVQRRAVRGVLEKWTAHGSIVLDPRALNAMARWARSAVGLTGATEIPRGDPVAGEILGVAGLCLIFPFAATIIVRLCQAQFAPEPAPAQLAMTALTARWSVAALLALSMVSVWYPQRLFPFYQGGYLASFMLVAGIALTLLLGKNLRGILDFRFAATIAAVALGLVACCSLAAWLHWQLTDVWLAGVRSYYFLPLFIANLPYTLAEETAFGPPEVKRRLARFTTFVTLRLILWLVLLAGVLIFLSGQVLTAILALFFVTVSLGQRFGADALRRRTGSPAAAAIFSAILAAWFMAAVFPLS